MGLNESYVAICRHILLMEPLPLVNCTLCRTLHCLMRANVDALEFTHTWTLTLLPPEKETHWMQIDLQNKI